MNVGDTGPVFSMKLTSFTDLEHLLELVTKHGLDSIEIDGIKVTRTIHLLQGGNTYPASGLIPEGNVEATDEDEEDLLYFSADGGN